MHGISCFNTYLWSCIHITYIVCVYICISSQNKEEDIYSEVRPFQRPASIEVDLMGQLKSWEIRTLARDTIE